MCILKVLNPPSTHGILKPMNDEILARDDPTLNRFGHPDTPVSHCVSLVASAKYCNAVPSTLRLGGCQPFGGFYVIQPPKSVPNRKELVTGLLQYFSMILMFLFGQQDAKADLGPRPPALCALRHPQPGTLGVASFVVSVSDVKNV